MELDSQHLARMNSPEDIRKFILGGKAYVMIVCQRKAVTYYIERAKNDGGSVLFFVSALDSKGFSQYLGQIYRGDYNYQHGRKSRLGAASNQAVTWELFYNVLIHTNRIHNEVEVWHQGRCGICAEPLQFAGDIRTGLHSSCTKILGSQS